MRTNPGCASRPFDTNTLHVSFGLNQNRIRCDRRTSAGAGVKNKNKKHAPRLIVETARTQPMKRRWWTMLLLWLMLWATVVGAARKAETDETHGRKHRIHIIRGALGESEWVSEQYMALMKIRQAMKDKATRRGARDRYRKGPRKRSRGYRRRLLREVQRQKSGLHRTTQCKKELIQIGTHNTRCLGAKGGIFDQKDKMECFVNLWEWRKWKIVWCLTDVCFGDEGVLEVIGNKTNWKIAYKGKMAIAMRREIQSRWEKRGSKIEATEDGRSIRVDIPREGASPGMKIISAYGPTGNEKKKKHARELFLTQLSALKGYNSKTS